MERVLRAKKRQRSFILLCFAIMAPGFFPFPTFHRVAPRTTASFENRPVSDPLVTAAGAGDIQVVSHLLDAGVSPNAGSSGGEGRSALSAAASGGQYAVVTLLLDRGADVNADDFWGGNAIVGPSLWGDVDMVRLLLAHGADPNMDDDGASALDYASHQLVFHETKAPRRNYSQIIRLLKLNGGRAMIMSDPFVSFGFFLPW